MEILNTIQSILPIGAVTISILTLLGIALLAALVLWVGQQALRLMLNAGHEKAPEYKFLEGNIVLEKLGKFSPLDYSNVSERDGGWVRRTGKDCHGDSSYASALWPFIPVCTWSDPSDVKNYCVFSTEFLAGGFKWFILIKLLTLDLILWLLPQYFTLTMTVLLSAGFIWTIRTLAGKLYENTSKTDVNEEKITDLETKINKQK